MEKRICSGCGRELTQEQDFCPDCGSPAKAVPQSAPAAQEPAAQEPSAPPRQEIPVRPAPPSYPQSPYQQAPYQQMPAVALTGKTGKGMGWIVFLRVILWVLFAAIVITSFVLAAPVFYASPAMAALIVLCGILTGFVVVAGGMIALNNATNLRSIAKNTALTVELLQRLNNKK